ncbi:MAG: hypothetical protein ACM3Q1_00625 [Bacteroidales bacterium]
MVDEERLIRCAQDLDRAFALLDRAGAAVQVMPSRPQLAVKQGLLEEARSAVAAAKAALEH